MKLSRAGGNRVQRNAEHKLNAANRRRCLRVEHLENRLLLSADTGVAYAQVAPDWFAELGDVQSGVALGGTAEATGSTANSTVDTTRWIVRLTPDATAQVSSLDDAIGLLGAGGSSIHKVRGLGLPGQLLVETIGSEQPFADNPHIAYAQHDASIGAQLLPDDPRLSELHGLNNTGQTGGVLDADIDAPEAWDITTGSYDVVVGLIDSGADYTHPDLARNIWINQNEIPTTLTNSLADVDLDGRFTFADLNDPANSSLVSDLNFNGFIDAGDLLADASWSDNVDTSGSGFVDDLFGWDFRNGDNNPLDDHGHGTHVAGTVGAIGNNGAEVVGVNWDTSLMLLKFLDQFNAGFTSDAILAINYATLMRTDFGENVRVTNNSWGTLGGFNSGLRDAIQASRDADILFVAAAGNGDLLGQGIDLDQQPFYPANYELDNIISVAAVDSSDVLAGFSNFGGDAVDIAAPGVGIISTHLGGGVLSRNGTSMATPHVAGAAALVFADRPSATALEVRAAVLTGADVAPTLTGDIAGSRRLNAFGALTASTFGPQATLVSAPDITTAGGTAQTIEVRYTDDEGVDLTTLDTTDIVVLREGFAAFHVTPTSATQSGVATDVTVTYELPATGGAWSAIDSGTYSIVLRAGQVQDDLGIRVAERQLGTFDVTISDTAVFFVDSTLDTIDANPGDGVAQDAQGRTTLRGAVMEASVAAAPRTIVVPDGIYVLALPGQDEDSGATGDLDLFGQLTVVGSGQATVDANGIDRVLHFHADADVNLSGLTLTGGNAVEGGGVFNDQADALIEQSTIQSNTAQQNGGGIYNFGDLNLLQTTVADNQAMGTLSGGGGGVYNASTLNVDQSTLSGNSTAAGIFGIGGGGAIFTEDVSSTTLTNSTLSGNVAINGDGGAILNAGSLTSVSSTITENISEQGEGGGIVNRDAPPEPFVIDSIFGANGRPGGEFNGITDIAYDAVGKSYVLDTGNRRVQVFDSQADHLFSFGAEGSADGLFDRPEGLTVDASGKIYVADTFNHRVQVFDAMGGFLFSFGSFGSGAGEFNQPHDVAVSGAGDIYVADLMNNRIQVFDSAGVFQQEFAPSLPGGFSLSPSSIALNSIGELHVADRQRDFVYVLDSLGAVLRQVGGFQLLDVAVDSQDNIYITDSSARVVHVFDSSGAPMSTLGGGSPWLPAAVAVNDLDEVQVGREGVNQINVYTSTGTLLQTFGQSNGSDSPRTVAFSPDDTVYVSDQLFNRVQVFDEGGELQSEFGEFGLGNGQFQRPSGVAFDDMLGRTYVVDSGNHRIQIFDSNGDYVNQTGTVGAAAGEFNNPQGIAVDASGNLIVADRDNNRVQLLEPSGFLMIDEITQGELTPLSEPSGVAIDPLSGLIYVADTGNDRIAVYIQFGHFTIFSFEFGSSGSGPGQFNRPTNVAYDLTAGALYVTDELNHRIQAFDTGGTFLFEFGSQGSSFGSFESPIGIASTSNGVYVTDKMNDRVQFLRRSALSGVATLSNTVVAANIASIAPDLAGQFESDGHNLIGDVADAIGFTDGIDNDQIGGFSSPPIDPLLSPLGDHSGFTQTHVPKNGSPLIDAGDNALAAATDQRGIARPQDGAQDLNFQVDIGAVERFFGSISGAKFADTNGDGVQNQGEDGLAGWTIYVDLNENGLFDPGEPSTVTQGDDPTTPGVNERGRYLLSGLSPGTYTIREIAQPTYIATSPRRVDPFATISISTIASSNAPTPHDPMTTFGAFGQSPRPAIVGGRIVFEDSGNNIYLATADGSEPITPLVTNTTLVPGGTGTFQLNTAFDATPAFDGQTAAFRGRDQGQEVGIFAVDEFGALTRVAGGDSVIPNRFETFDDEFGVQAPSVAQGLIAFTGKSSLALPGSSAVRGIYAGTPTGQLATLVDTDTPIPNGSGMFEVLFDASFDAGQYAFRGSGSGQDGIYLGQSLTEIDVVVDRNTAIPNGAGMFTGFGGITDGLSAFDQSNGVVAFRGLGSSGQDGIYVGTGPNELAVVADTNTSIPDGTGMFTGFRSGIAIDGDRILFVGEGASGQTGVYSAVEGALRKVVDLSDTIDGKTPTTFDIGRDGLDGNQLVVHIAFTDGSRGLHVAEFEAASIHTVTLATGQELSTLDFGARPLAGEIRGHKFHDLNGDSFRDLGEPGLAGWTIYLDQNNNQVLDAGEQSVVTGQDGSYTFSNLPALTTYNVAEVQQEGWDQTYPNAASSGRWTIALGAGRTRNDIDFGNVESAQGGANTNTILSGVLFTDSNNNAMQDTGEQGLAGRMVFIDLNDNGVFDNVTEQGLPEPLVMTDGSGNYQFENLPAGSYVVRMVSLEGEQLVAPLGNELTLADLDTVTGEDTTSVVAADFDGQNGPDLASINAATNNVTWFLNDGAGGFTQSQSLRVNAGPSSLATGHFNNDAHLDLAISHSQFASVALLLGDGAGGFTRTTDLAVPAGFSGITAADFDGDNFDDLALAIDVTSKVHIYINDDLTNGAATFTSATPVNVGANPIAITSGLVDNDQLPDLVVGNFSSGSVQILLNSGSGAFAAQPPLAVGRGPSSIAIADLNGDNSPDLAVANVLSSDVSLIYSNGVGGFHGQFTSPAGAGPRGVDAIDLEGDGDIDLVVGNLTSSDVSLLRNDGQGGFSAPENLGVAVLAGATNLGVKGVVAEDFNGDGLADVAAAKGDRFNGFVSILQNTISQGAHRVLGDGQNIVVDLNFAVRIDTGLPGDYDNSGVVDQLDYDVWKTHFGSTSGPGLAADGNDDGVVNAVDYAVWRENLGATSSAAATSSAGETVASVFALSEPAEPAEPLAASIEPEVADAALPSFIARLPVATEPASTIRPAATSLQGPQEWFNRTGRWLLYDEPTGAQPSIETSLSSFGNEDEETHELRDARDEALANDLGDPWLFFE